MIFLAGKKYLNDRSIIINKENIIIGSMKRYNGNITLFVPEEENKLNNNLINNKAIINNPIILNVNFTHNP